MCPRLEVFFNAAAQIQIEGAEQWERITKTIEVGKAREGYWCSSHFFHHVAEALAAFDQQFADIDRAVGVFVFDNSSVGVEGKSDYTLNQLTCMMS